MEFEWWEAKRLAALNDRRLDFLDGRCMFDGRPICTASSPCGGEERWVSLRELDNERSRSFGRGVVRPSASSR